MDEDLATLSREQLIDEVRKLRGGFAHIGTAPCLGWPPNTNTAPTNGG